MTTIKYAGVPLLLADPGFEFQVWLERSLSFHDMALFGELPGYLSEAGQLAQDCEIQVGLAVPNYSSNRPPQWKLNTLWWPTGAYRFSIGLFLANDEQLSAIEKELTKNKSSSSSDLVAELEINDGANPAIKTEMYLLPPQRVTNVEGHDSCWLICLVDERFYWQRLNAGNISIDNDSEWSDLFDQIDTSLSIELKYDDVASEYGQPNPAELTRRYENPALILDAAAASIGARVVRTPDGKVSLERPEDSQNTVDGLIEDAEVIAGGNASEINRGRYPRAVQVVFPKRLDCDAIGPTSEVHMVETLAADADFKGKTTSYDLKTFRSTAVASFDGTSPDDPSNDTAINDLAKQISKDYYAWLSRQYDYSLPGVAAWTPNGFDDWVWWHAAYQSNVEHSQLQRRLTDELQDLPLKIRDQDYSVFTRVTSHPIDFGVANQLQQLVDYNFRPPTMIIGTITADVTQSDDFITINNVQLIFGVDPRPTTRGPGQSILIPNTHGQSYDSGTKLLAWQKCADGTWITERFGSGSSTPATPALPFRLTEDLTSAGADYAKAEITDSLGDPIVDPTATYELEVADEADRLALTEGAGAGQVEVGDYVLQRDTMHLWELTASNPALGGSWTDRGLATLEVTVIDVEQGQVGLAAYTGADGSSQDPYRGSCRYMGTADYESTGRPGYEIIRMQGPATGIVVSLTVNVTGTVGYEATITNASVPQLGSNNSGRIPKQETFDNGSDPDTFGVTVHNTLNAANGAKAAEQWLALYNNQQDRYELISKLAPGAKIIRGLSTLTYADAAPSWVIDNITQLHPPGGSYLPAATETATNVFGVAVSAGDTVIAIFNTFNSQFEGFVPAGGGSSSSNPTTVPFRLTADMGNANPHAAGQLIDAAGNAITPATPDVTVADEAARLALADPAEVTANDIVKQTDTDRLWRYDGVDPSDAGNWTDLGPASANVTIVDKTVQAGGASPAGRFGLAEYSDARDGSTQPGYVGECRAMGIPDYSGTGLPGYEIISMEGPADGMLVKLLENGSPSKTELSVEILQVLGSNEAARVPKQVLPNFLIYDDDKITAQAVINDVFLVQRDHGTSKYRAVSGSGGYMLIKGIAKVALSGAGTIAIDNVTALQGRSPVALVTDEITVAVGQSSRVAALETVYALYDPTAGLSVSTRWRLTYSIDITQRLKGYNGWSDSGSAHQRFVNDGGVIRWETIEPQASGGGGGGGSGTLPFRLTSVKLHTDAVSDAQLIDSAGNAIVVPAADHIKADEAARLAMVAGVGVGQIQINQHVKQVDTDRMWRFLGGDPSDSASWEDAGQGSVDIAVVDKTYQVGTNSPAGRYGLNDYIDAKGASQQGFTGECRYTGISDFGGTGKPGYEIVSMEGPADELLVKLLEEPPINSPDEMQLEVEVIEAYGSNEAARMPARVVTGGGSGSETYGFLIYDDQKFTRGEITNNLITVKRDHATNKYRPVRASTFSGVAKISQEVSGATSPAANVIKYGKGKMKLYVDNEAVGGDEDMLTQDEWDIYTMSPDVTEVGENIAFGVYRGRRMIGVEPCNNL